jgi:hypothetical protein
VGSAASSVGGPKEAGRRVYVLRETVGQRGLNGLRRIPDEVEHPVALEAIVNKTTAGADHHPRIAEHVPCDTEPRSPLIAPVFAEVLVDALTGPTDSVERVAATRHFKAVFAR